jgi:hypothetical protein
MKLKERTTEEILATLRHEVRSALDSLDFAAPETWPLHIARIRDALKDSYRRMDV